MPETLRLDIIDGHKGRITNVGLELDRHAIVSGVTGTAHEKIIRASQVSGMPQVGDPHPAKEGCILQVIDVTALDTDTVKMVLRYAQRPIDSSSEYPLPGSPPRIEGGASLSQVTTNRDHTGALVTVSYTYPDDYKHDTKLRGETIEQPGEMTKLSPESTITLLTTEVASPAAKANAYVGKINASTWEGGASRTWLCIAIRYRSDDGGQTYQVSYNFQRRPDTWDTEAEFIDPYTGRPPPDLVDGVGRKPVQHYKTANFVTLFR